MTVTTSMRFTVDGWDPAYGNAFDIDDGALVESTASVDTGVEMAEGSWAPIVPVGGQSLPSATLFVDGVRRIDARVWIDPTDPTQVPGLSICASIAAGVVCCCPGRAHVTSVQPRRLLVTTDAQAQDLVTTAATWQVAHTTASTDVALLPALSQALQRRLADLEVATAIEARTQLSADGLPGDSDLLIVDGPLRGRTHLPRALGYIKTHRSEYLPPQLNAVVAKLAPSERTPVFLLGSTWDRHAWYLRLPCASRAPWAGVVRVECSADLPTAAAIGLAFLSQTVLPPHAASEFRDPRAPQNLTPIGGLEHHLRHRLGDSRLLYRSLQGASERRLG
jgi:hypothetical protein